MAKKTKAWVKGIIAVAVIAVVGALGYYGANGELFQGRSFRVAQPKAKTVETVDKVIVDGVDDASIKQITDRTDLSDKVAIDSGEKLGITVEKVLSDLTVGDSDVNIMEIQLENPSEKAILVSELSILEEGAGINDYELFLGREKVNTSVSVDKVYIDKLDKEVSRITFSFERPYQLLSKNTEKAIIKADIIDRKGGFVSHELDRIKTDAGFKINTDYNFEKKLIKAGKVL